MPIYCTHCGTALTQGSLFCPGCGQKVAPDPVPNPAAPPNPAPGAQPAAPQYVAPPPQASYGQQPPFGAGNAPQNPNLQQPGSALQTVPGISALPPAMRLPALGIVVLLALALLGKMFGHSGTAAPGLSGAPGGGSAAPTTAQAGVFSGRCTTEQGTPLANVDVKIAGVTSTGQNTVTDIRTDANGDYSQSLPPGNYSIYTALYPVTLGPTSYMLPLALKDGVNNDVTDIGPGIARDLVLHIHGKIAPTLPDTAWQSFYGGNITTDIHGRYYGPGVPSGSMTELTLVPVGPLADGTTGQTLTLRVTNGVSDFGNEANFLDIPIGQYTITARLLNADGSLLEPLIIGPDRAMEDLSQYKPSIVGLTFPPSTITSPYPNIGQGTGIGLLQLSLNDGSPGT